MIRYSWDDESVEQDILAIDPRWKTKAANRTRALNALGCYEEKSSIWSVVKPVYMRLQHNKCIYCERQLEGGTYGPIEWDLEHFRPKSNVDVWPNPKRHPGIRYGFSLGNASLTGYYWLAYDLRNYSASCKVCNTIFKLNFFPTLNGRVEALQTGAGLREEGALLCYPIGDEDEDPEDLISYVLTTAVPKHPEGPKNIRARVIIEFFGLNNRELLHRQRAQMIGIAGSILSERDHGADVTAALDTLLRPSMPFAACVRAFLRLWQESPVVARRGYEQCRLYGLDSLLAPPTI